MSSDERPNNSFFEISVSFASSRHDIVILCNVNARDCIGARDTAEWQHKKSCKFDVIK
jgi:hypothetical protein